MKTMAKLFMQNLRANWLRFAAGQKRIQSLLRALLCGWYSKVSRLNRYLNGNTETTPVFDLVNAGDNHRFATPTCIVSNCLLLGYYGGWKKFQGMMAKPPYNLVISDEAAQAAVKQYREGSPRVVNHWYSHQKWLKISAIDQDATHEVALPNGRILRYFEPRTDGDEITAMNELGGNRFKLHAGILTNNEIQSISRDIMCDAWLALDAAGIPVLWSVHDELVFEVPEDQVDAAVPRIRELMTTSSSWAAGCPLDVEITVADRYCKD